MIDNIIDYIMGLDFSEMLHFISAVMIPMLLVIARNAIRKGLVSRAEAITSRLELDTVKTEYKKYKDDTDLCLKDLQNKIEGLFKVNSIAYVNSNIDGAAKTAILNLIDDISKDKKVSVTTAKEIKNIAIDKVVEKKKTILDELIEKNKGV